MKRPITLTCENDECANCNKPTKPFIPLNAHFSRACPECGAARYWAFYERPEDVKERGANDGKG